MWDGVLSKTDTIFNSSTNEYLPALSSYSLTMRVIARKINNQQLKLFFRLPFAGFQKFYEATTSDDYSLRSIFPQRGASTGSSFYALAYILPYEKDGRKMWCEVEKSNDVMLWGKTFGLKHYLVFKMRFY